MQCVIERKKGNRYAFNCRWQTNHYTQCVRIRNHDTQSHVISMPTKVCSAASIRGVDTEAGMLSGISRERSIRSNPYWFTEFCNSQCSSHFAAPSSLFEPRHPSLKVVTRICRVDNHSWKYVSQANRVRGHTRQQAQERKTVRSRPTALEDLPGGIDVISIPAQTLTQVCSQ